MIDRERIFVALVTTVLACNQDEPAAPPPSREVVTDDRAAEAAPDPTPSDAPRVDEEPAPTPPPPTATKPTPLPRVSLATSDRHTCAVVRRRGEDVDRIKCWGHNGAGELGLGDRRSRTAAERSMGDALPFVSLAATSSIVAIDANTGRTCALEANGTLWCWGDGISSGVTDEAPPAPAIVALPGPVVSFGLGLEHSCAGLDDGSLRCWGRSAEGALGSADPLAPSPELPAVSLGSGVLAHQVVTGMEHTCVRLDRGGIKCFGVGANGMLGLDHTRSVGAAPDEMGDALLPVSLGSGFEAATLSSGALHTCALSSAHEVQCWGANRMGQLGRGHSHSAGHKPGQDPSALPTGGARGRVDLGSSGRVVAIDAGNSHTCALIERGSGDAGLKCWGAGGQPPPPRGDDPDEMGDALPFIDLGTDLVPLAISAGAHTCAIVAASAELEGARPTTGRLKCWGQDPDGATGIEQDPWDFERPDAMGDALPFVDLGTDVGVVVP